MHGFFQQAQVGSSFYFITDNGDGTYTLWRNDSAASPAGGISPSQSRVLGAVSTDPAGVGPYQLTAFGHDLFFGAWSQADGWGVWKVAGADAPGGDVPAATPFTYTGSDSNGPSVIKAAGSTLYFTADAPGSSDVVWWRTDGTPDGTVPVDNTAGGLVPGIGGYGPAYDGVGLIAVDTAAGTDLYQILLGGALWRISGSSGSAVASSVGDPGATSAVFNVFPPDQNDYLMTAAGGAVYFATNVPGANAYEVWRCVGSTATVVWQSSPATYYGYTPLQMVAVGSDVYFSDHSQFNSYPQHLVKIDGASGVADVIESYPGGHPTVISGLTAVGSTLYFEGMDGRLWQTGGSSETPQPTGIVLASGGEFFT